MKLVIDANCRGVSTAICSRQILEGLLSLLELLISGIEEKG